MRDVKERGKTDTHKGANYQKTTCKMEKNVRFYKIFKVVIKNMFRKVKKIK